MTKLGKFLSGLRFEYLKEDDSELGKVDFGVLTVAMMIAALDGVIRPEELASFEKLAKKCRVSEGERAARYESALHSAGYIMLISRSGISKRAIVEAFVREAAKVLPKGFAGGNATDIRRALVIWVTMGMSDGDFCGIERACVEAFRDKVAEIMRRRRDCKEELWRNLNPAFRSACGYGCKPSSAKGASFDGDILNRVEQLVAADDAAAIRKFIING